MEYTGIDYINKTPNENANILFDSVCVEFIKRNEVLFNRVKKITKLHCEIMIDKTHKADKKRDVLLTLEPTWKAIRKELENVQMIIS